MRIELFVGYIFFCSFWAIGIFNVHVKYCYSCPGSPSYEDCQSNLTRQEVPEDYACVQYYMRFDNGSMKMDQVYKGGTSKRVCEQINKGNISETCHNPFFECKAKCCYEDDCNKGNILDTSGQFSSSRKAVFTSDGVVAMGLFLGVSLTAFNVIY